MPKVVITLDFSKLVVLSDGKRVLNCTSLPCRIADDDVVVTVEPCGARLPVTKRITSAGRRGSVTKLEPSPEGLAEIDAIRAIASDAVVIGTEQASLAYRDHGVVDPPPALGHHFDDPGRQVRTLQPPNKRHRNDWAEVNMLSLRHGR